MKKLLIGLCAAAMLAASALSYAGTVTFVNKYDEPVKFVVSDGPFYNPVVAGIVMPGNWYTFNTDGPSTSDYYFMAHPISQPVVSNCGRLMYPVDNLTVKAGWSKMTGTFTCRLYETPKYVAPEKHKTCHYKK